MNLEHRPDHSVNWPRAVQTSVATAGRSSSCPRWGILCERTLMGHHGCLHRGLGLHHSANVWGLESYQASGPP
jgi:hypothetical protein